MWGFRMVEIEQIKSVASIVGRPIPDFDKMTDLDVANEWMELYEEYPIFFGE